MCCYPVNSMQVPIPYILVGHKMLFSSVYYGTGVFCVYCFCCDTPIITFRFPFLFLKSEAVKEFGTMVRKENFFLSFYKAIFIPKCAIIVLETKQMEKEDKAENNRLSL